MTIQSLAKELYDDLETAQRPNGGDFLRLKDGHPQWMQDVIRTAHSDLMPDDWRYKFIEDACQAIIEHEDDRDSAYESLEADIYNHDLLQWLASNLSRIGYCDDAAQDFGISDGSIINIIQWGQLSEKQETFNLLYDALESLALKQESAA